MSTPVRPMATRSYAAVLAWVLILRPPPRSAARPRRAGSTGWCARRPPGPAPSGSPRKDGVLLEDVPPGIPVALEGVDDRGDVDVALAEGHVHPAGDGLGVGRLAGLDLPGPVEADVLEVDVGDPVRVLRLRDGDRVAAADEQVTGVEAQPDAAAGEHPVGLLARLDHGADVRVQGGGEAASGGSLLDPVEVAQQRLPSRCRRARDGRRSPPARSPRRARRSRRAPATSAVHRPLDLGEGVVAGSWSTTGTNCPTALSPWAARRSALACGVGGEEAVGTELGGGQADLAHLGQDDARRRLAAPAGHLAHAPRDGGTGDALAMLRSGGHRWCLTGSRDLGQVDDAPLGRDSSQASATRNACSASSTVQGLGPSPRATSAKAVSSAR